MHLLVFVFVFVSLLISTTFRPARPLSSRPKTGRAHVKKPRGFTSEEGQAAFEAWCRKKAEEAKQRKQQHEKANGSAEVRLLCLFIFMFSSLLMFVCSRPLCCFLFLGSHLIAVG